MQLPDIGSAVLAVAEGERKRFPCHVNRASSIGYFVPQLQGCLRRGVYERTHWQEKELWDASSILRFREGNAQEKQVLKDLADAGFTVIEQQTAYEWKDYQITGHIDGKLLIDDTAVPLEIKSSAPSIFSQIQTWEDLLRHSWLRAYQAQITVYMLLQGIDIGILLFKDKSSGAMKQINCKLDYELGEWCIKAAEAINKHIAAKTEPDRTEDRQTCANCPFKHLCLPDLDFGVPLKIVDDPLFEQRLERCAQLREASVEYTKGWDVVRGEAKSTAGDSELNLMVGKYHLTGRKDRRGSFRLNVEVV